MFFVEMARVCWGFNLRFIGSLVLPFHHCVPIDVLEELVPHYELRVGKPLSRVFLKETGNNVFDNWCVVFLPSDFVLLYSLEEFFAVCAVEWWGSCNHFIQQDSKAPPITLFPILALLL